MAGFVGSLDVGGGESGETSRKREASSMYYSVCESLLPSFLQLFFGLLTVQRPLPTRKHTHTKGTFMRASFDNVTSSLLVVVK